MNSLEISVIIVIVVGCFYGLMTPNAKIVYANSISLDRYKDQLLSFVFFCGVLLSLFRFFINIHSVPDLYGYSLGYQKIEHIAFLQVPFWNIDVVKMPEIGFRLFMKTVSLFSGSFSVFLLIYGVIWFYLYYRQIRSYSPYIVLSIVLLALGSYSQSLIVLRQHFAMAIVFNTFPFIIKQDLKKYLLIMTVAFLFHQTALVFLPVYFLYSVKNNKKLISLLILVSAVAISSFTYLLTYFGTNLLIGYESYLNVEDKLTNATGALISLCNLIAFMFSLKKHMLDEGINRLLFILLFMSVMLNFAGIGLGPTSRLFAYYSSIGFLVYPITYLHINNKLIKTAYLLLSLSLVSYMFFFGSGSQFFQDISIDL